MVLLISNKDFTANNTIRDRGSFHNKRLIHKENVIILNVCIPITELQNT